MEEMTTKEKIITESLKLFSSNGYDGVSMREIATAVGIKGASIYNHFKGKEDIFHAIFDEMTKQYSSAAMTLNVPMEENSETTETYKNAGQTQLLQMCDGLFSFFAQNEFAAMFRKLLVSEQFKSPVAAQCYKDYYLNAPMEFQKDLFAGLQQLGSFKGYSPEMLALNFYAPIFYVLSRFDAGYNYEECLELLHNHVIHFCKIYSQDRIL